MRYKIAVSVIRLSILAVALWCGVLTASAQTTAFSYQGQLNDGGSPANGSYDMQFKLFDALNIGTQVGSTVSLTSVAVSSGIFTVTLDFGASAFPGANRWLEISVRLAGGGTFTTLTPRQPLTSTPYAIKSLSTATADGLSAACVGCVTSAQIGSLPANSGNYIQNTTTPQTANFNISGNGSIGGKVGIGIGADSALRKLHVVESTSNLLFGHEGAAVLRVTNGAPSSIAALNLGNTARDWQLRIDGTDANKFRIYDATAIAPRLTIAANGNVGIGEATDPVTRLDISGSDSLFNGVALRLFNSNASNTNQWVLGTGGAFVAKDAFSIGDSNAIRMTISSNGNVGIGVTNPFTSLHLPETGMQIGASATATDNFYLGSTVHNTRGFRLYNGNYGFGISLLAVLTNGNVGIGTPEPQQVLHVNGNSEILSTGNGAGFKFRKRGSVNSADDWTWYASGDSAYLNRAGTNVVKINTHDQVGIGIDIPIGKLDVSTDSQGTAIRGETFVAFGNGVAGTANVSNGYGVWGVSQTISGLAGKFDGNVNVTGNLSKGGGSFKIDHPLDPENKYLYHSFVESPDMMNIYNGNVTTNAEGEATITMPDYFEALNRDFRYQLTVIGQFAQAIIASKISGNNFTIKTDKPNVEVSWQVTGVRQDAYANKHRIPVEEAKPERERGTYLRPEVFGQPEEKGVEWALRPEMMRQMKEQREKSQQANQSQQH